LSGNRSGGTGENGERVCLKSEMAEQKQWVCGEYVEHRNSGAKMASTSNDGKQKNKKMATTGDR